MQRVTGFLGVLLLGFVFVAGGYLGIDVRPVDVQDEAALGVKPGAGVVISDLVEDGPAEKAGILLDDVIVAVNKKPVKKPEDLMAIVSVKNPGDKVTFTLMRKKEKLDVTVTMAVRPKGEQGSPVPKWLRDARKEFTPRAAALKPDDVAGHYDLGMWARRNGLGGAAQIEFHKVLAIDPDHAEARAAAGYVKEGDAWVRDYLGTAKKIKAEPEARVKNLPGWTRLGSIFTDTEKLARVLEAIDRKAGLYRHADDLDITVKLLSHAEGQGVTWPESVMPSGKRAPPFKISIELDGGTVLTDETHARQVITHELTHALQGDVQPWWPSWFAEGVASYITGDSVRAYAEGKSFFVRLEQAHGMEKMRLFLGKITDEWQSPDDAAREIYGKTVDELKNASK